MKNSLAEFVPAGTKKAQSVFGRDMCVDENTSQAVSVEFVCSEQTNSARNGLQLYQKSGIAAFLKMAQAS